MTRDFYESLGVNKDSSPDEIKKAYKNLAKKYHPDLHKGDKDKEEKFKEINEAYKVLSDEKSKVNYDRFGTADSGGFQAGNTGFDFRDFDFNFDINDVFGDFFGFPGSRRQGSRKKRGADLRYDMEISLTEAYNGGKKEITVKKFEKCSKCNGLGTEKKSDFETCSKCRGTGYVQRAQRTPFGIFSSTSACDSCNGEGKILKNPCRECDGAGRVEAMRTIVITIPAGVDNGSKLRIQGEGEFLGDSAGDLYIVIHVQEDDIFTREEDDLYIEQPISFAKAALGGEIEVPAIDGKAMLHIPPGTQTNTIFKMHGKGMPHLGSRGAGDEMVKIIVETPKNLSRRQKELLEEFEKETKTGFFKNVF